MKLFFHYLIIFFSICVLNLFAQNKYPSRDSEEWNNLTVKERWDAMNLPEEQLQNMTTDELVEHCINFDFMWDIFNHKDLKTGLEFIIENHNALSELLKRNDAAERILERYKKTELSSIKTMNNLVERGEFGGRIFFLELFLCNSRLVSQLKGKEIETMKKVLDSYDNCIKINENSKREFFCKRFIMTKILVLGRMLENKEGRELVNPALIKMDLSKLTDYCIKEILENTRRL